MRVAAPLALALLASCGSTPKPTAPAPPTIADLPDYLAQTICPDGAIQIAEPGCVGARLQQASDPLYMRRYDWGASAPQPGFVAQDGFVMDNAMAYVNTWAWWVGQPPGDVHAYYGNGGEAYVLSGNGHTVRISVTQDGGKPYLQGFYGVGCGGTGWVAFGDDAPSGSWRTLTATLSDVTVPGQCAHKSQSLTRYRLEQVTIPFEINGAQASETLPCVIGEHYNTGSMGSASAMERSMWCKGVGRTVWEAWGTAAPTDPSIPSRCPGTDWSAAPAAGWYMEDCRYATRLVVTVEATMTGDRFGWPPPVASWP